MPPPSPGPMPEPLPSPSPVPWPEPVPPPAARALARRRLLRHFLQQRLPDCVVSAAIGATGAITGGSVLASSGGGGGSPAWVAAANRRRQPARRNRAADLLRPLPLRLRRRRPHLHSAAATAAARTGQREEDQPDRLGFRLDELGPLVRVREAQAADDQQHRRPPARAATSRRASGTVVARGCAAAAPRSRPTPLGIADFDALRPARGPARRAPPPRAGRSGPTPDPRRRAGTCATDRISPRVPADPEHLRFGDACRLARSRAACRRREDALASMSC